MQLQHVLEGQALRLVHSGHGPLDLGQEGGVQGNPLAPELHKPFAARDQLSELRLGEVGVADGDAPVEVDQRIQPEQRPAAAAALAGADLGAQARLFAAGGFPPCRQQHLPAGLQQVPAVDREEPPCDLVAKRFPKHIAPAADVLAGQALPQARQPPGRPLADVLRPRCGPAPMRLSVVREPQRHKRGFVALVLQQQLKPPEGRVPVRLQQLQHGTERRGVRLPADGHQPAVRVHPRGRQPAAAEQQREFAPQVARFGFRAVIPLEDRRREGGLQPFLESAAFP
ncbi:hypothetical protein D3C73_815220 [compost metagenome]